jgi:hypothetical protein
MRRRRRRRRMTKKAGKKKEDKEEGRGEGQEDRATGIRSGRDQ